MRAPHLACTSTRALHLMNLILCISRVHLYAGTSSRLHISCMSTHAPHLACTSTCAPHLACTSRAYIRVHLMHLTLCTPTCAHLIHIYACTSTHAPHLVCTSSALFALVRQSTSCTSSRVHLYECTSSRVHLLCFICTRAPFNLVDPSSPSAIKMDLDHSVSHCYILAISPLYFSLINSFWPSALSHNYC